MGFLGVTHPQVHPHVCDEHEQLLLCRFQMLRHQECLQVFVLGRSLEFCQVYLASSLGEKQQIAAPVDGALLSKVMLLDGTQEPQLPWTVGLLGE